MFYSLSVRDRTADSDSVVSDYIRRLSGMSPPMDGGDPADGRFLFLKSFDLELHIALYVSDVPCVVCDDRQSVCTQNSVGHF